MTSFVTEYRHRSKSHNSAFTIEIEYLNKTEINEQLHELLWSYRQPFTVKGEDIDQDDYAKMESESKVALDTLEGIFGNRAETNAKYLQDPADDAFDSILKQLTSIASSLKWPEGAHDGKWTSTAENAGECQEKTGTFMKGDLWPFIKIVR